MYLNIYALLYTVNVYLVPEPCLMILHPPDSEPATPEQVRARKSFAIMRWDLRDMFEPDWVPGSCSMASLTMFERDSPQGISCVSG